MSCAPPTKARSRSAAPRRCPSRRRTSSTRTRSSTTTAPTLRAGSWSDSPPERDLEWTESGVTGAWRFQQRLFRIASTALALLPPVGTARPAELCAAAIELRRAAHRAIAGVSTDIEAFHFNKAVARPYALANPIDPTEPTAQGT